MRLTRRPAPFAALIMMPVIVLIAGCASGPLENDHWVPPRSLGSDLADPRPGTAAAAPAHAAIPEPTGAITLREALAAALVRSPELDTAAYEIRALEAEQLQAGLLPNPELAVEVENFGGSGPFGGFGAAETTVALGQLVELGGKRATRVRVADLESGLAGWDYEMTRIAVLGKTASDFIEVLAARRRIGIAEDLVAIAEGVMGAVVERVGAGKVSPVEQTRAEVELAQAKRELEAARRDHVAARIVLSSNWGSIDPIFGNLSGSLDRIIEPPPLSAILERLEASPDIERWAAEAALRQARLELALAQRIPDLTLAGGVRYHAEVGETSFVAGLEMPLAIFDRNQGGIEAAHLRLAQGHRMAAVTRSRIASTVARSFYALESAYVDALAVRDQVLPGAESVFAASEEAFKQGKIGAIELLIAQRTFFDARRSLIDALATYHRAAVAVERLTGTPLHGSDAGDIGDMGNDETQDRNPIERRP